MGNLEIAANLYIHLPISKFYCDIDNYLYERTYLIKDPDIYCYEN